MKFTSPKKILIATSLLAIIQGGCESPIPKRPLSVGSFIPPLDIRIDISGSSNEASLDDFKDKLIILEFISTSCGTCKMSVPYLQELQEDFRDEISVILVTQQNDSLVKEVVENYQWSLPIITEDSVLSRLFPYLSVPHQVWIKDREVFAITHWQYANKANIRKLLDGDQVKTPLKEEDSIDFTRPLSAVSIQPHYQSFIAPPIGYGSGIRKEGNNFLVYNAKIPELYRYAFGMPAFPMEAYVISEASDTIQRLINGPGTHISGEYESDSAYFAWRERYTFCYNLVYPKGTSIPTIELQETMQQDLNRFFGAYLGIIGTEEKRKVRCLALISTGDKIQYATNGGKPSLSKAEGNYQIINQPLQLLLRQISYQHYDLGTPVINATGYHGNVDLEFKGGLGNLQNVNQGLKKYGLQFVEKDMEVDVVVISDKREEIL